MTEETPDAVTPEDDQPGAPAKPPAKKAAARKAVAKKAPAKKSPVKKAAATDGGVPGAAGETPAKQATARKAPAKKAVAEPVADQPADAGGDAPVEQNPAAAAARRARRIGGRAAGAGATRPTGESTTPETGEPAAGPTPAESVSVRKGPPRQAVDAPTAAEPETGYDDELGEPEPVVVTQVPAWLNWAPAGVLAAGALVMAVLLVVLSHGVWWGPDPKDVPGSSSAPVVRERVLAAAKTCLATTNSYEYTDMDTFQAEALACSTGAFTDQLRDTIENVLKPNVADLKAVQACQINRGGIEAVSPGGEQWTILLFGQLQVTNTNFPKGRTDPFAAQVVMEREDGKWLIARLNSVSSPVS